MDFTRAAGIAAILALVACDDLPPPDTIDNVIYLDQGWSDPERQTYYYTPQGTELFALRYDWLLALEEPFSRKRFARPENLTRYRFIVDKNRAAQEDGLPIGFTKHWDEKRDAYIFDLTCAACHTGQIEYNGQAIRIDGGPALHSYVGFGVAVAQALGVTYANPWKFDRFARKVLKNKYPAGKEQLRADVYETVAGFGEWGFTGWWQELYPVDEGFGRIDAVGRIGNTVFGDDLDPANYHPADAPVSFPQVWDIWRFDWVQWNGSSQQPMARNVSESLGVRAEVSLIGSDGQALPAAKLFDSTVLVEDMHCIETTLQQLKAPRWPERILGRVDRAKAEKGRALFEANCQHCHGPHPLVREEMTAYGEGFCGDGSITSPDAIGGWKPGGWKLTMVCTDEIGTDSTATDNWMDNLFDGSKIMPGNAALRRRLNAAEGLSTVAEAVIERKYRESGISPDGDRASAMDGFAIKNAAQSIRVYKARPLDGIWATAPFLHNGSVPNVYQMLLPQEERDTVFYVGSREFDPKHLGFKSEKTPGAFKFDTKIPGNRNTGHQFRDDKDGNVGVIGRGFSDEERWQIIEYLKILDTARDYPPAPGEPACASNR